MRLISVLSALLAAAFIGTDCVAQAFSAKAQYMVIDLSGGADAAKYPVSFSAQPPDLDFDTCRTKELWLRLIPAGKFAMGSPPNELGRNGNETPHRVALSQPFYIGVFQVTQKQYELVMGAAPSRSGYTGDTRPVEKASYDTLRGSEDGAQWPAGNKVDADSFFGVLRAKIPFLADLPTEAQWEYACRAGTTTALNSGKNLTNRDDCPNMAQVGRYFYNWNDRKGDGADQHTKVGMYLPNAWGLYDMHGNIRELCLDWWGNYDTAVGSNPKGPKSGTDRVARGGCAYSKDDVAHTCRSASRYWVNPGKVWDWTGFRIVVLPGDVPQAVTPRQPLDQPPPAAAPFNAEEAARLDGQLAAECAEFKAVLESYKENADKIKAETQPRIDALNGQYQKALEGARDTVQGKGDLDKARAVVAEIARFGTEKSVPSKPDDAAIAELKALQTSYNRAYAPLEKEMNTRLATLTQRYGQALEQLQSSLVKAGRLDEATGVKAARERAKNMADALRKP